MAQPMIQDLFNSPRRKRRPAVWARRIAGLAVAVSGGTLLAADLVRMVSASPVPAASFITGIAARPAP